MQEKEKDGKKKGKKRKQMVRTAQTGLWVTLILVQMAVVNCLTVKAEAAGGGDHEGDTVRQIQKDVVYERVEGCTILPDSLDIQVQEEGDTVTVACSLQEITVLREEWDDSFSFPITVHTYDAEYYQLGDELIPYNEERPQLEGCEEQLLEMIGVPPEEYRIDRLEWSGEPYRAEDGSLCRDALGSGSKRLRDYRVRYAGTAWFPVRKTAQEETGTGHEETENVTAATETLGEVGPHVQIQEESSAASGADKEEPFGFWQKITRTLLIIIGIGALLFLGGLLILAFLWVVKKLRKWYTKRKHGGTRGHGRNGH